MSKWNALSEQYDGGRAVFVEQEGSLVSISVEAQSGANAGVALLTPSQARHIAEELTRLAILADEGGIPE